MNTIFVHELRVETRIGIYAWEQHLAQPLLIDLELALPSAKAFASDDFAEGIRAFLEKRRPRWPSIATVPDTGS